jgi:Tol biopolymer transport system component
MLAAAGMWAILRLAPQAARPEARVELVTPPTADPASLALAPDGRSIAVVATDGGVSRLCVRALAEAACRLLAGTEFATQPFWSPDGRALAFFADARVKSIDLATGVVRTVSTAPVPAGGAWGGRGDILHPVVPDSPIFRVRQDGSLVPATTLAPGQSGHHAPSFLPDGRRFLFYAAGNAAARGVYLAELGSPAARRLVDADGPAVFAAPGHLLYVQNATLFVQAFDLTQGRPVGAPVRLADHVRADSVTGPPPVTASAEGTLAYRTGPVAPRRQFVWFDRQGRELARVGAAEERGPAYGSMSPDGRRLAIQRTTAGNTDIWIVDLERGPAVRFTTAPQADIAPAWSPGGDRIAFASQVNGVFELFEQRLDESNPRPLLRTGEAKQITDWSRDGSRLLFRSVTTGPRGDMDVWALALDGGAAPVPVVRTPFEERDAQFSPDGRWIAFQSNDSGRPEIYVQPFPGPGERMRISTDGGVQVRWRADGRELFYLSPDGRLHAAAIALPAGSGRPHAGAPVALFAARTGATQGSALASYLPAPDGQRFLVDLVIEQPPAPIALILEWHRP